MLVAAFGDRRYILDAEPKVRELLDDEAWGEVAWNLGDIPSLGLLVWEGDCIFYEDGSPSFEPCGPYGGTYRPLTDAEWGRLHKGKAPWDDK